MPFVTDIGQDTAVDVGVADTPEGLSAIHQPGAATTLWLVGWQALPDFQSWIDGLDPDGLPRARVILRLDAVRNAPAEICNASGASVGRERDRLVDEIAALADIFTGLDRRA